MIDDNYNPSNCRITKAFVYSTTGNRENILNFITEVSIVQSIESISLRGAITVIDTLGMLENFPLRGEERLELELEGSDTGIIKKLNLQIYKIDNITIKDGNDGLRYMLHFISKPSYDASKRKLLESYDNEISTIVKSIFAKSYGKIKQEPVEYAFGTKLYELTKDKYLFIQPTEGYFRCVIPNYSPTDAIYFLASRSYSTDSPSCSFRFFETMDSFNFVTDEFLIKNAIDNDEVKRFTYNTVTSKNPEDMIQQIINLEQIENPMRVDTAKDLYSGAYRNKVIEIDLLKKKVTNIDYNYLDDYDYINMSGKPETIRSSSVHTTDFIEQTFTEENAKQFILFKDYGSIGDLPGEIRGEQYIPQIVSNRQAYFYHLNNTVVNAQLKGRLDLAAGNIVELDILEFNSSDNRIKNPQLSGNYMIHTINHNLIGDTLSTIMRLIKYDWSV